MVKEFDTRKYTINLRRDYLRVPKPKRSKRAVVTIKKFVEKHTRADKGSVIIGQELNNHLWSRGSKNPPNKVNVFVKRLEDDRVLVNLEGVRMKRLREEKEETEEKEKVEKPAKKPKKKEEEESTVEEYFDMNVAPTKEAIKEEGFSKDELKQLLKHEESNKDRVTLKKFIKKELSKE